MTYFLKGLLGEKPLDESSYSLLVKDYWLLQVEYQVICAQVARALLVPDVKQEAIEAHFKEAHELAGVLEVVYRDYLCVPREASRMARERRFYETYIPELKTDWECEDAPEDTHTQTIRRITRESNWVRLVSLRTKRLLKTLLPAFHRLHAYSRFMANLDYYANPAIAYIGWMFFLPRLVANLSVLSQHTFSHHWMGKKEASLDWQLRAGLSAERRWFELANDVAWLVVGLLNCFLFVGGLATVGIYLAYALFVYDVITALIRAHVELARFERLRVIYVDKGDQALIDALDERIAFEQKRLYLSVATTVALLVAMTFTLPFLSLGIAMPIVVASSLVLITIASYVANTYLERYRPVSSIETVEKKGLLATQGFFSSRSNLEDTDDEPLELLPLNWHEEHVKMAIGLPE